MAKFSDKGIGIKVTLNKVDMETVKRQMKELVADLKKITTDNPIHINFDNKEANLIMENLRKIQQTAKDIGVDGLKEDLQEVLKLSKQLEQSTQNVDKITTAKNDVTGANQTKTLVRLNPFTTKAFTRGVDKNGNEIKKEILSENLAKQQKLGDEYFENWKKQNDEMINRERNSIITEQHIIERRKRNAQELIDLWNKGALVKHAFNEEQRKESKTEVVKDLKKEWTTEEETKKRQEALKKQEQLDDEYVANYLRNIEEAEQKVLQERSDNYFKSWQEQNSRNVDYEKNAILTEQKIQNERQNNAEELKKLWDKIATSTHNFNEQQRKNSKNIIVSEMQQNWEKEEKAKKQSQKTENDIFKKTIQLQERMYKLKKENLKLDDNSEVKANNILRIKAMESEIEDKKQNKLKGAKLFKVLENGRELDKDFKALEKDTKNDAQLQKRNALYNEAVNKLSEYYKLLNKIVNTKDPVKADVLRQQAQTARLLYKTATQELDDSQKADIAIAEGYQKRELRIQNNARLQRKALDEQKQKESELKTIQTDMYNFAEASLRRQYQLKTQLLSAQGKEKALLKQQLEIEEEKTKQIFNQKDNATTMLRPDQVANLSMLKDRLNDKFKVAELGGNKDSFSNTMKHAFEKFSQWIVATKVVMGSIHQIEKGFSFVNELNKDLTEIAIVTGQTQREMTDEVKEYNKFAKEMGVTTRDVTKATVEFYRQGLKQAEVMERMNATTMYGKISNLDFAESAKILTATVNSMEVDVMRASDVFSYLGDVTSSGSDELGRAFQRVGGSSKSLQVDFEKVSSWIALLSSKTRESAEVIGNSIKGLMSRYSQLRERGFTEEDGTKVNQVSKALAEVGIEIIDQQGNFRNFGTVMDELGGKWSSLTNRQRSYISTTLAGTHQSSR